MTETSTTTETIDEIRTRIEAIGRQNDELTKLGREVCDAQLDHIRKQEARAVMAEARDRLQFEQFQKDNAPAARRQRRRHQLAMAAMNGTVWGEELTDADIDQLAKDAFRVADRMLELEGFGPAIAVEEDPDPDPPETPRPLAEEEPHDTDPPPSLTDEPEDDHPLKRWLSFPDTLDMTKQEGKASIGVNGHQVFAPTRVTYEEVVAFAFPFARTRHHVVKFTGCAAPRTEGELLPHETVEVEWDARFTVTPLGEAP